MNPSLAEQIRQNESERRIWNEETARRTSDAEAAAAIIPPRAGTPKFVATAEAHEWSCHASVLYFRGEFFANLGQIVADEQTGQIEMGPLPPAKIGQLLAALNRP